MKKIILLLLLSPSLIMAQFAAIDFFEINDGMEDQYLELEKVWVEFHKQNIEDGKMYGWSLFKVESSNSENGEGPDYMTLNRFETKEDMDSIWNGVTMESFLKVVGKRLKGKMSSRQIKKILEAKVKKSHHHYVIELKDQTMPPVEMEIGEILNVDAMVQNVDDYEKYESNWAKPIFQNNVDDGNVKWWGFTKVIDRNDQAIEQITHFTWRIPVMGKNLDWKSEKNQSMFGGEFTFGKIVGLVQESRNVFGNGKLKLIMSDK
jgi:hypothetical protein